MYVSAYKKYIASNGRNCLMEQSYCNGNVWVDEYCTASYLAFSALIAKSMSHYECCNTALVGQ